MLLSGCGGGSSGTTATTSTEKSGYLIDSAVQGVDYTCGTITGTTEANGKFTYDATKCPTGVEFKLKDLSLGSINPSSINADTYLTLQELAGKTRNDVTDETVQKMAVLLQSLDDDNNPDNGIKIDSTLKSNITLSGNLSAKTDNEISTEITAQGKTEKDVNDALVHLLSTLTSKGITTTANINPTDFTIANQTGTALNSQVVSDTITIAGLTIPTYITITNGEYSLDNGTTWKSTKSLVSNGQTVKVRHTTANSLSGTTTTTLKIGGVTKTFGSTTRTNLSLYKVGNIVIDTTNLQWQDEPYTQAEIDANIDGNVESGKTLYLANAISYCENLTLDSYTDWRLPTLVELQTIIDTNSNPTIKTGFQNVIGLFYWTSTNNYGVQFSNGSNYQGNPNLSGSVRCVRGGN